MSGVLVRIACVTAALVLLSACDSQPAGAAVRVNDDTMPASLYHSLVHAQQYRVEHSGIPIDWNSPDGSQRLRSIQAGAIKTLVRDAVIEQLGRENHLGVSHAELDLAVGRIETALGGPVAIAAKFNEDGLSRADFALLFRYRLLEMKLSRQDPRGYAAAIDRAVRAARVFVYVGPCASDHRYPSCADL